MCDHHPLFRLLLCALIALLASCASPTYLSWRLETTGFLGDRPELTGGGEGELPQHSRVAGPPLCATTAMLVESPTIWRTDRAPLREASRTALTELAKELENRIRAALDDRCAIVHAPAAGVLRVRLALVEDAETWVVADTFTTASRGRTPRAFRRHHPIAPAAIEFARGARVEIRVSDAMTGEIRFLGRSGPVVPGGGGAEASWRAVAAGFDRVAAELSRTLRPPAARAPATRAKP